MEEANVAFATYVVELRETSLRQNNVDRGKASPRFVALQLKFKFSNLIPRAENKQNKLILRAVLVRILPCQYSSDHRMTM